MNNKKSNSDFVCWSILNSDQVRSRTRIVNAWKALLNDKATPEETYHRFLHDNAGWFFADGIWRLIVLSKIRLGANWITDFVSTYSQLSYGFNYELIEIESPHTPPFSKAGKPSMRLVAAVQQIHSWKQWIEGNRDEAKRLFPSTLFSVHDTASFRFTIYIGTRENTANWLERRNFYSKEVGIEIRSFDALTDHLMRRPVMNFWLGGDEVAFSPLSLHVRNRLMNPFAKAYTDTIWRAMISNPKFKLFHMITTNAELLLQNRTYSKEHLVFMKDLRNIPETVKNVHLGKSLKYA